LSLVGNLADLGLGEILQIVSLSRKSGILTLQSRGRQGVVVFRFGQVIRATSSAIRYYLGEELLKRQVVDEECLKKALQAQQATAYKERLGPILIHKFNVPAQKIEDVVREQIERVVYSFFSWDEGNFEFELQEDVEAIDDSKIDPLQFMLEQGLNPQFLAMEGSRIIDEKRHRGDQLDEEYPPPEADEHEVAFDLIDHEPVPATSPEAVDTPQKSPYGELVVVEDDSVVREFLVDLLTTTGYEVFSFAGSEEALITIDTLYRDGKRPCVLLDLIMPRMDGSGVLGGLELLELLRGNFEELPILVTSEYRNSDAERRIREVGANFILKPRRGELADGQANQEFSTKVVESLQTIVSGAPASSQSSEVNLGDELRLELGDITDQPSSTVVPSTGISMLRGMLEELNDPALGGGVILLLLRFAAEFVNRAVIFLVKENDIVGLGQFGIVLPNRSADVAIRNLKIPRNEDSLFSRVMEGRIPLKNAPEHTPWNDHLFAKLGGVPAEVFLGPLLSEGEVVAILYGDNYPEAKPIGDTDSLEIFLSQAGLAMEKAVLEKRLGALTVKT
jgi:CheY-like chemotaxis protein